MDNLQPRHISSLSLAQEKSRLESLRNRLGDAIANRGRYYSNISAVTLRFEADETRADHDAKVFQRILKMLGLPPAQEWIVPRGARPVPYYINMMDTFMVRM